MERPQHNCTANQKGGDAVLLLPNFPGEKWSISYVGEYNEEYINIDYCPFCGEKLEPMDEAARGTVFCF